MVRTPTMQQTLSQQVVQVGQSMDSSQHLGLDLQEGQIEQGPLLGRLSHPGLHRGAGQAQRGQVARQGLRPEWSSQNRSRQVERVSQE